MAELTKNQIVCFFITAVIIVIGFGASVAGIYDNRPDYTSDSCPRIILYNNRSYVAEKDIWAQWHWTYELNSQNVDIERSCPTVNVDVDIYVNGRLYTRSDKKTFSTTSRNYIRNCHGNVEYIIETPNALSTLINWNGIYTSLLLKNSNGTVLAYVSGTTFFDYDFDIISATTNFVVAHMSRDYVSIPWKWNFKINDNTSDGAKPEVLFTIAGRTSFGDSGDKDDTCNTYFWSVSWTVVAIVGFLVIVIFCIVGYIFWKSIKLCWIKITECYTTTSHKILPSSMTSEHEMI